MSSTVSTTTTQDVRMHGWTIPAGTTVQVERITLPMEWAGQQVATATVQVPGVEHRCGVPVPSLDVVALGDVPVYRYDDATGRDVLVD